MTGVPLKPAEPEAAAVPAQRTSLGVPELLARCDAAMRDAGGGRPLVLLAVPGHLTARRHLIRLGSARLWARVMGWRDLGKATAATVVRLFVDDVHRELLRVGLASRTASVELQAPAETAAPSMGLEPAEDDACVGAHP